MRRYIENGGNFRGVLAERHPAQALDLSRGQMRSVFSEYLDHNPTVESVGDLDQFGLGAGQEFRPLLRIAKSKRQKGPGSHAYSTLGWRSRAGRCRA